jgi:hypothetical protein
MKVDVFTAPLSEEGKEILKDRNAALDLLYKLLNDAERGPFEVKAGDRRFQVSSSASPIDPTHPR